MLALENADEILQILDRFTKQKSKEIPPELEEYIDFVAKTGDTVYRWQTVQYLFREKLRNVIKEFHDTTASIEDLPQCPNVDQFNYESMKTLLFERFDHFQAAPFTIQRLCELLTAPKKHYSRLDKFMRALEKNILVVSTTEPGRKPTDGENGDESMNGDILSAISVGIETTKNILKGDTENTNGNLKNNGTVNDVPIDEIASSSGVTKSDSADVAVTVKVAEPLKDQPKVESSEKDLTEEKTVSEDKPTVEDKTKVDVDPLADDNKKDDPVAKEKPSTVEPSDVSTTDQIDKAIVEEAVSTQQNKEENAKVEESNEAVMKEIPSDTKDVEQSIIGKVESISPVKEPTVSDRPTTPKRPCSDDDHDLVENGDRSAKKIKLDTSASVEREKTVEPQPPEPESPKVESTEKTKTLDIDEAKKEDELLEDVVDSALAAEQVKVDSSTDTPPIVEKSVNEKEPIEKPLEPVVDDKPKAPVDSITPVSSELIVDFTPDEVLNELVSSDSATDVVPTEPNVEETLTESGDNNIAEPIVTAPATPVEMNVEETETAVPVAVVASETSDTAMEAAPIKTDEEMEVDESNSADAMDL